MLARCHNVSFWAESMTVLVDSCWNVQEVTVVGSSMGASIIWAYIELYGEDRLSSAVFVDQVRHKPTRVTVTFALYKEL